MFTSSFLEICNMKHRDSKYKAILITPEILSSDNHEDIIKAISIMTGRDLSYLSKIFKGTANPSIDVLQDIAGSQGMRYVILPVPESSSLKRLLLRYGEEKQHYWKIPKEGCITLFDFFVEAARNHDITPCPSVTKAVYILTAIIARAALINHGSDELSQILEGFSNEIATFMWK